MITFIALKRTNLLRPHPETADVNVGHTHGAGWMTNLRSPKCGKVELTREKAAKHARFARRIKGLRMYTYKCPKGAHWHVSTR